MMTNEITLLPLSREKVSEELATEVIEACGLVLPWVLEASPNRPLAPQLQEAYGFPMIPLTGGEVYYNGLFTYPEDPDLEPLVKVFRPQTGETFFQYDYGIVAIRSKDGSVFVTRMD